MKAHFNSVIDSGYLEVVTGPMFSGKTEELIRRVRRAQLARIKVQIFKPAIDTRYDKSNVVSHSSQSVVARPVERALEILQNLYDSTRIVAIDEAQFFEEEIVTVVAKLTRRGYRVILAGLDLDYRGIPFGSMPALLAMADEVMKYQAICTICGGPASKTQRIMPEEGQILVGESSTYEARCRAHHEFHVPVEELLPLQDEILKGARESHELRGS